MEKKLPKCKQCKERFVPFFNNSLQKFCTKNDECIKTHSEYANKQKQKEINKRAKNKKTDHPEVYSKELKVDFQKIINLIVRTIDKDVKCIDCHRTDTPQWDAGHYRSRGNSPALRYNLINIFKQTSFCNNHSEGDKGVFMNGIKEMYGEENAQKVEDLELKYPKLQMPNSELPEKMKEARKILKELKALDMVFTPKVRWELREKYNNRLGIYLNT